MKLLDSLYKIEEQCCEGAQSNFLIRLNPEHFIYAAHFPGEPITPGVCIMQIAFELTECALGCPLTIDTVKSIKFLKIISPKEVETLNCRVKAEESGETVKSQVSLQNGEDIFAKLSLICRK